MPATARPMQALSRAGGTAPKLYSPRHPEHTLLYKTVGEHLETWHAPASDGHSPGAPYQSVIESISFHFSLPLVRNARWFNGCYGEVTSRV